MLDCLITRLFKRDLVNNMVDKYAVIKSFRFAKPASAYYEKDMFQF